MRLLSVLALFGLVGLVQAEDKPPTGAFTKKAGDFDITWEFKKDKVIFKMTNGSDGCTMESKATFEKDGVVKCEIEKFEKQGNFPVDRDKGMKFSFKYKVDGKKVTISDLEGDDISDEAKNTVHGDYEEAAK